MWSAFFVFMVFVHERAGRPTNKQTNEQKYTPGSRVALGGITILQALLVPQLLLSAHLEAELAAANQIAMRNPRLAVLLAIEPYTLNILILL